MKKWVRFKTDAQNDRLDNLEREVRDLVRGFRYDTVHAGDYSRAQKELRNFLTYETDKGPVTVKDALAAILLHLELELTVEPLVNSGVRVVRAKSK